MHFDYRWALHVHELGITRSSTAVIQHESGGGFTHVQATAHPRRAYRRTQRIHRSLHQYKTKVRCVSLE